MTLGAENVLITNPRDIPGFVKEMGKHPLHRVHRRQHAVQRAAEQCRLSQARFLDAANDAGRRHGGAEGGGRPLERSDRQAADRGLRADRDLAGGDHQSARPAANTTARSACRFHRPTSCCATTTARRCRSASRGEICIKGPQVMAGYWQPAGRDGEGDRRATAGSPPATSA